MGSYMSSETATTTAETRTLTEEDLERACIVHPHPEGLVLDNEGVEGLEKDDVEGCDGAFLVEELFSEAECAMIVEAGETIGFTVAPVSTSRGPELHPEIRTNMRVMFEGSPEFMGAIADRVRDILPRTVRANPPRIGEEGEWVLVTDREAMLNERIRIYRYLDGEVFCPHFDGCFPRTRTNISLLTLIVYLSDGFEGGETTFFPEGRVSFVSPTGTKDPIAIRPVTGRALLFPHGPAKQSPFHEGTPHTTPGVYKYAFRTDVMYEWVGSSEELRERD